MKSKTPDGEEEAKRRVPDPEKPIGPFIKLSQRSDTPSARFKSMLARTRDLYKVKPQHREELFDYMCEELARQSRSKLRESFQKFAAACERLQRSKTDRDNRVIMRTHVQIVGCTITGLSKYRQLLSMLGPDVLIIDEASEATEGSITAALLPSLQHLALVGDHQQLTPHAIHPLLTQPMFTLDVSLFERLVTDGMPYKMLNMQRRMIPRIRQLVNLFYPDLRDHSSVSKRDPAKGIGPPLWWFDHTYPEQSSSGASGHSFSNIREAEMIVEFTKYLFRCGIPVDKVTILTFYTGQQELIQSKLGVDKLGSNICKTVDSFQGCENDVVLLSVVRSSVPGQKPNVGFVDNLHRVTVALSRARNAFYIFGNAANLTASATWHPVIDALGPLKNTYLPLVCPAHGTKTVVRCSRDWSAVSGEGGCRGELCEKDKASQPKHPNAVTTVGPKKQVKRVTFTPKHKEKLNRAALDQVDAMSAERKTPSGDNTSSTCVSQDSTVYSSDSMLENGYYACIAEFDEMVTSNRDMMLIERERESLIDIQEVEDEQQEGQVLLDLANMVASVDLVELAETNGRWEAEDLICLE